MPPNSVTEEQKNMSTLTENGPAIVPSAGHTRRPYEVYSQPLEDRDHAKRELVALVDGTPNFAPHYYAVCKSGLAIAVNAGGRNAASDIAFLAHAANCHDDLLEALKVIAKNASAMAVDPMQSNRGLWAACRDDALAAIAKASPTDGALSDQQRSGTP